MKTIFKKTIVIMISIILTVSAFSGCKNTAKDKTTNVSGEDKYGVTYPLQTDESLSMWIIHAVHPEYKTYQDMPFYQEVQKRTGVKLDIIGPTGGQFEESFNLMIASDELPDLIMYDWAEKKIVGGPEKYIKDGYIISLNDAYKKYAPNLTKILKENPDVDKMIKTDLGNYYVFPNFSVEDRVSWGGPVVRKDWLDELGLPIPETIDDWHTMLTRFKNEKNSTSPLVYLDWLFDVTGFLSGAYGEICDFYIDNGKVSYGPANPGWKDFLTTVHKWYQEGLIDKDIATLDASGKDSRVLSGKNGAFLGSGGDMGSYIPAIAKLDPKAKFVGVPYPVLNRGETPKFGQKDLKYTTLMSTAVTTDCKDVELASKFMDWFYTKDGILLGNYGIEGITYNMVDEVPTITDMVINSGNFQNEMRKYAVAEFTIFEPWYYEQRMIYPEQKNALPVWSKTNMLEHKMPPLLPNEEESQEIAKYMTAIGTYTTEMYIKFMIGSESLNNFDKYIERINSMGMQRVLEIYQGVYERYMSR